VKLQTKLFELFLESPIYNASGPLCVTEEELDAIDASESSVVLTKSCTLEPRLGNGLPRYQGFSWGSINSMGLPNLGVNSYLAYAEKTGRKSQRQKKPLCISVAGLSVLENETILKRVSDSYLFDALELNLSCPNVSGKPQIAYDLESLPQVLDRLIPLVKGKIGVKLPPYFDPVHWDQVCGILNRYPIHFVTAINSVGNTLAFMPDSTRVAIAPKQGLGGLGGAIIKPIALSNVRELRLRLRSEIDVIGCGGIESGRDILEHLLCGAQAVQVGTQMMREGVSVFGRLKNELVRELSRLGFKTADEARGKWSSWVPLEASSPAEY
jgi:dihydroorotate dehydrogenase (fumarate)